MNQLHTDIGNGPGTPSQGDPARMFQLDRSRCRAGRCGKQLWQLALVLGLAATVAACGGGSNSGNSAAHPSDPPPRPVLSKDQQVFEQAELAGGESTISFQFPFGGGSLVSGKDFVSATTTALGQSPTNGPQKQTPTLTSLSSALIAPTSAPGRIRVLQGGQILVSSGTAERLVTYSGTGIRRDRYADDGATVVDSEFSSDFSAIPLSGDMTQSPGELLAALPLSTWINLNTFTAGKAWMSGSGYIKSHSHRLGDTVFGIDCGASTTTAALTPCQSGTTLDNFFPHTFQNATTFHPVETDFAADGTLSTIQGVRMWVAAAPLPQVQNNTSALRVFYELNGNVYAGFLEKDGTPLNMKQASGNVVDYEITLNEAAVNSVAAGVLTNGTPGVERGSGAAVPSVDLFGLGAHGVKGAIAPADLRVHYNIPTALNGAGQTIAIVDAPGIGDPIDDLNVFSAYYGLPLCNDSNPCLRQMDLSNGATGASAAEIAIDVQMVHAIAPAANIVLVIAKSSSLSDRMAAVRTAAAITGVVAVSMSFSFSETADEHTTFDPIFTQHPGVIFFASSGDTGSHTQPPLVVAHPFPTSAYPAASPYVTAVGGTRWGSLASSGAAAEVAWQFSGGGASLYEPMPSFQTNFLSGSALLSLNNGMRAVPDVAGIADPANSAFGIYFELAWHMEGGTSVATPLWAGLSALLAQEMATAGKSLPTLVQTTPGGFNGLIYQGMATQGTAAGFFPVTSGSNDLTITVCALCLARPGYNDVTGLGAPDFLVLLSH
jgi:hypothetical protein